MDGNRSREKATIMGFVAGNAPVSTREVAEELECSRREAELRLRELYADGRLESESIGRELVWRPAPNRPLEDRNG